MTVRPSHTQVSRLLAAGSLLAGVALYVSSRLGIGRTPMRSVEILVVPVLALLFMYPTYALASIVPITLIGRTEKTFSDKRLQGVLGAVAVFGMLLVIWVVFGPLLQSQWGPIDDHEIMDFIGSDSTAYIREIPALLSRTEAGAYGASPRFRPTYYFLRIAESIAWGNNPTLWYACRLILLAIGATICWSLMTSALGKIGSAILCLYALSFGYWVEIVGRLGPSETYTVVGLPIYLYGVIRATRKGTLPSGKRLLACAGIFFGSVLCIGAKENYLLLALPTTYLLYLAIRRSDYLLLATAAGSLLFALYVGSSVIIALSHTGSDTYGNSISLGLRLAEIVSVIRRSHYMTPFSMLMGLALTVGAIGWIPGLTPEQRGGVRSAQFWLLLLCFVYLSQLIFYNANWPATIIRYSFPGLLYLPASVVILCRLAKGLMAGPASNGIPQFALSASVLVSLILAIAYHGAYADTIWAVQGKVAATWDFTSRLQRVVFRLKQDERLQLVVESGDVLDWEPALAYPRFLNAYQVANPLYLRVNGYSSDTVTPGLRTRLATELQQRSIEGGWGYSPLGSLDEGPTQCISLFLSVRYSTSCTPIE